MITSDVAVVRAEAKDAARLTKIVRASGAYRDRYAAMVAGYTVPPDYVEAHLVFLARDEGGRTLGFYALIREPAELDLMFVADAAQGRGIGRLLVDHMLDQAGQAGLAEVRVVSHPPAEEFYLRCGARRIGTVPAQPRLVAWDRPELAFTVGEAAVDGAAEPAGTSPSTPKELVRAFLLQVRSGEFPERADRFMAASVRAHQVQAESPVTVERSPRQYAAHVREMKAAYGDFAFALDELIAEGDRVYARWHHEGRHLGEVDGHPPTGEPLVEFASAVYRVEHGRVVEYWIQIDRQGIAAQLERSARA